MIHIKLNTHMFHWLRICFFYLDESSLVSIDKNQILALVFNCTTYGKVNSMKRINSQILSQIFTTFSNLQILKLCESSLWYQQLSFFDPYTDINCSTLLKLHIRLISFYDCLVILDGRFNKLHTLHVDIQSICLSLTDSTHENQVDYFC